MGRTCGTPSPASTPTSAAGTTPVIEIYPSVVALAVVLTLLLQALPARRLAGRLGLLET